MCLVFIKEEEPTPSLPNAIDTEAKPEPEISYSEVPKDEPGEARPEESTSLEEVETKPLEEQPSFEYVIPHPPPPPPPPRPPRPALHAPRAPA